MFCCLTPPPALAAVILCLGLLRKTARAAGAVRNSGRMDPRNPSVSLSMLRGIGVLRWCSPAGSPVWSGASPSSGNGGAVLDEAPDGSGRQVGGGEVWGLALLDWAAALAGPWWRAH